MRTVIHTAIFASASLGCLLLAGCGKTPAPIVAALPPKATTAPPVEPFEIHSLAPGRTTLDEFRSQFPGAVISDSVRFSLIPEVSELNYQLPPGPTPELTIADRWIIGISATFLNQKPVEIVIRLDPTGARGSLAQALVVKFGKATGGTVRDPAGLTWVRRDREHHYVLSFSEDVIHLSDQAMLQTLWQRKSAADHAFSLPNPHSSVPPLRSFSAGLE